MRQGEFFPIPECPADVERLWRQSRPLAPGALPRWLAPQDAAGYRCLAVPSPAPVPPDVRPRYLAEVQELEAAGVIVEADPTHPSVSRLYIGRRNDDLWSIGIYAGDSPLDLAPIDGVDAVLGPGDVTDAPAIAVADPFMVRVGGLWHMFFEVMTWPASKGEIAWAVSDDGVRWTYRQIVLAEPFHLSFPCVFEWAGRYYMVPESDQAGAVRLYRATSFPTGWSRVATLLTGPRLVDPSVFHHANRWWMFVETNTSRRHDTLRLYVAETLTGPWHEHPCSPIVEGDAAAARPAGRVLADQGRLIRFAQNCRPRYGTDVRAFEITDLTATRYAEREICPRPVLAAGRSRWNACGMHHVDAHRLDDGHVIACVDGRAESA